MAGGESLHGVAAKLETERGSSLGLKTETGREGSSILSEGAGQQSSERAGQRVGEQSGERTSGHRLVLASSSPRRRALLLQAGFVFTVEAAEVDETAWAGEDGVRLAIRLAQTKAEAIEAGKGKVIVGADTVVAAPNGELLGKPRDEPDAARMLALLSGSTHQVVTGVCVRDADRVAVAAAMTYVRMHTVSEAEIWAYIRSGEPLGKAGAYAIQGLAARWIPSVHGEYSNVVGLPLALVSEMLACFSVFPVGAPAAVASKHVEQR